MVRSDERAGMRTVTVLVDLPPARRRHRVERLARRLDGARGMLGGGHPVRLLGGRSTRPVEAGRPDATHAHVRDGAGSNGRIELLDRCIDLEPAPTDTESESDLLAAASELTAGTAGHDLVLAVVGALGPRGRAALAGVADSSDAFAVVRVPQLAGGMRRDAEVTLAALRRAGWHACPAEPGESMEDVWTRLLETAR